MAAAACADADAPTGEPAFATPTAATTPETSPAPTLELTPTPAPPPVPTLAPTAIPAVPEADFHAYPFTLGVASGDPTDTSVILWTRLLTAPGQEELPGGDHEVLWELATSDSFSSVVAAGLASAPAQHGHSVHVDVGDLRPDTWYAYRFRVGSYTSGTGRTRTFPSPDSSPTALKFAFSSCQHYQHGYYAAHRHLAADGLDAFVWLGDYIYERGPLKKIFDRARLHDGPEAVTLADYRARYAQYKRDADLQAHHASHPWIVTWDDHEVDGNYAGDLSQNNDDPEVFLTRRAAGYQAWYEHMPVRLDPPDGADMQFYRSLRWGDLAEFFVLDTRQHRDHPPTDGDFISLGDLTDTKLALRTLSPGALDPSRQVLGNSQQQWLVASMTASTSVWNVLAQSVLMQGFSTLLGQEPPLVIIDGWDGYMGNRNVLLSELSQAGVENIVVLTGDLHMSIAGDVRIDPYDDSSPVVAAEFVSSSISSALGRITTRASPTALEANSQMRFIDTRRGYVVCELSRETFTAVYMALEDVQDPQSGVSEAARIPVIAGHPGLA